MELRHLRYFVAVAEEENVTRAAARLHVSQPPLSRQIRDLEDELGVALFTRRAKSLHLTPAGRAFLGEAREVLARADDAVRRVRRLGAAGEIHLGYAPSPTADLLARVSKAVQKDRPGLRFRLHDLSTPEMLAGLREGRLQAAFLVKPPRSSLHGIEFRPLEESPVNLVVAPSHPLARRRQVTLAEVRDEGFVVLARAEYPDYHEFLRERLGPVARRLRVAEECDGGASVITAVAGGRGVAIAATLDRVAGRRLRYIPFFPPLAPAVVGVAWRRGALEGAARAVVDAAVKLAEPGEG